MLPDDGPNGPKHVGAIQGGILSVSCSILCFNKECICWQRSFEFILNLHRSFEHKYEKLKKKIASLWTEN
jgi:hypothetical protein